MRTLASVFASSFVFSIVACGGQLVSSDPEGSGPSASASGARGASSGPSASPPSSTVPAPAATSSAQPRPAAELDPTCMTDADCNETSDASLRGRCWRDPKTLASSCLCLVGSWKQPSGKCAPVAPTTTCASLGGTCEDWGMCLNRGGYRSTGTGCGGAGPFDDCCESQCKTTAVTSCYVHGSDAAYMPLCTNGWQTCKPGDSPELEF